MRIEDSKATDWIVKVLRERGKASRAESETRIKSKERELQVHFNDSTMRLIWEFERW